MKALLLLLLATSGFTLNIIPKMKLPSLFSSKPALDSEEFFKGLLPNPFVIRPEKVAELTKFYGIDKEELLKHLVFVASTFAQAPISNYKVGAAALGRSGTIYLGINLEFLGFPLHQTVHAEQFLLAHARAHGETELVTLALTAAPCGHCRQFLNEIGNQDLKILFAESKETLGTLLPEAFGPQNLGLTGGLLTHVPSNHAFLDDSLLLAKAFEAFVSSYAPYTESPSSIAIRTKDGKIYTGSYLENVAFNPSLSPLQTALISFAADLRNYDEIEKVLLLEKPNPKISQELLSKELLKSLAPEAIFLTKTQELEK